MVEKRLLRLNRKATALFVAAAAAGVLGTGLLVGQTCYLSRAVDAVFLRRAHLSAVLPLLGAAALLLLLRSVLCGAADILLQRAASGIKGDLRRRLAAQLYALGPLYTEGERSGELVSTAGAGVEALDEYVTQHLPARVWAVLNTLVLFLAILWLDPPTTLILLVAAPMLILLLSLIGGQARRLTQQRFQELSFMSAFYLDILQGLPTLKLFGRSREQAATIEAISRRFGETTLQVLATAFQSSLMMEWAATAATAMVALEVSLRLVGGSITYGPALAVLLLTPEFFLPLRQMAIKYHAGASGKAAGARIFAILDTPAGLPWRQAGLAGRAPGGPSLPLLPAAIRFEHVTYTYRSQDEAAARAPALHDVSFVLPEGKTTALVGASGTGKTTVANLLLQLLHPTGGRILAGGVDLGGVDPARWRRQVAAVPQRPHLFGGTAADNIGLGKPGASLDEIMAAAEAAHAHEFLAALPQGYATLLGERGARLSGGQRQRVAIARAFLKDAPLLILDEALAGLDAESEAHIEDALRRLMAGRTVLVIAHRLQLAAAADQVIVLEGGRVAAVGPHPVLLAQDAVYRRLAAAHAGGG